MKKMLRQFLAVVVYTFFAAALSPVFAGAAESAPADAPLSAAELEQLVAPVALYPDALLAQVFMASTYPLEVVSAARWSKDNPKIQGKDLNAAMEKQTWDVSVKSLAAFPQVLQMMSDQIDWTEKLGNAFLAQQKDAMDAVQRLRAKAQAQGTLTSGKQQTVTVKPASAAAPQTIIIEPAQPTTVYVPAYNPTVVYGPWPYPAYPPYPVYPPGAVVASSMLSFGVGMMVGDALWGDMNWGHGDVDIDVNNYRNFTNINPPDNWHDNGGRWQHDPQHRKGVPYANQTLENRFQGAGHDAVRDQQRAKAREDFRGRGDSPAGRGSQRGEGAQPGRGGKSGGAPSHPGGQTHTGKAGKASRQENHGHSAFQGVDRGEHARGDSKRGAGSRSAMRSQADGGVLGGSGIRGGGAEHTPHGGNRLLRR